MIDIGTQLRSYQKASNIRGETRLMCGRAADEIDRLNGECRASMTEIANLRAEIDRLRAREREPQCR